MSSARVANCASRAGEGAVPAGRGGRRRYGTGYERGGKAADEVESRAGPQRGVPCVVGSHTPPSCDVWRLNDSRAVVSRFLGFSARGAAGGRARNYVTCELRRAHAQRATLAYSITLLAPHVAPAESRQKVSECCPGKARCALCSCGDDDASSRRIFARTASSTLKPA